MTWSVGATMLDSRVRPNQRITKILGVFAHFTGLLFFQELLYQFFSSLFKLGADGFTTARLVGEEPPFILRKRNFGVLCFSTKQHNQMRHDVFVRSERAFAKQTHKVN